MKKIISNDYSSVCKAWLLVAESKSSVRVWLINILTSLGPLSSGPWMTKEFILTACWNDICKSICSSTSDCKKVVVDGVKQCSHVWSSLWFKHSDCDLFIKPTKSI